MNAAAVRTRVPPSVELDGRRRRGQDNKARIVAAMLEMVREGELAPSAEQVAARADVGLRTVFRHFQDMDSLYREIGAVVGRRVRAILGDVRASGRTAVGQFENVFFLEGNLHFLKTRDDLANAYDRFFTDARIRNFERYLVHFLVADADERNDLQRVQLRRDRRIIHGSRL